MNGAAREIVARGLRAVRRSMWWWAFGVVVFIVINLAFWPSLEDSDALESFEEMDELLAAFGAQDITTPAGYLDGQVFALLLPLLLAAMAITVVSALTAGDESAGRLELLHALPVGRGTIWFGRWLASLAMLLVVAACALLATLVALPLFSLSEVGVGRVAGAMAGCVLLAALHAAVTYLSAALGASRPLAVGIAIVLLVAGYVAAFVLPISDSLSGARSWSPWYWSLGEQPVSDGVPVGWMSLVALLVIALVVAGTAAIERRDIRTA